MIEGIIMCSKSFKMRAINLLLSLAYMCIFKIIIKFKSISNFPIVITLEVEPYPVAKPDVQSSLNV